eukprot:UN26958
MLRKIWDGKRKKKKATFFQLLEVILNLQLIRSLIQEDIQLFGQIESAHSKNKKMLPVIFLFE